MRFGTSGVTEKIRKIIKNNKKIIENSGHMSLRDEKLSFKLTKKTGNRFWQISGKTKILPMW